MALFDDFFPASNTTIGRGKSYYGAIYNPPRSGSLGGGEEGMSSRLGYTRSIKGGCSIFPAAFPKTVQIGDFLLIYGVCFLMQMEVSGF